MYGKKSTEQNRVENRENAFLNASVVIFHGQTKKKKVKIEGYRLYMYYCTFIFRFPELHVNV